MSYQDFDRIIRHNFKTVGPYVGVKFIKIDLTLNKAMVVMNDQKFLGIITLRDIGLNPHQLVIDCLTEKPIIDTSDSFEQVLEAFNKSNEIVLPVFSKAKFNGLLFINDLIRFISENKSLIESNNKLLLNGNKQLMEMNKEVEEMVYSISHDLKTPLTNIRALVEILEEEIREEEKKDLITYTKKACDKANEIINQLLQYGKLQKQKIPGEVSEINSLLESILLVFKINAEQKDIIFVYNLKKEIFVRINRVDFTRIIDNIISNAIKFTSSGGKIRLSTTKKNHNVIIKISDNGIGIPENFQDIIFNRFTKAKRKGTKGENSVGLGMSIAKKIIESYSGKISFKSNENKGTTFFIEFPAAE